VAVVGAPTVVGSRLREALAGYGVRGERVDLYGDAPADEALLSEYDGEARLIQSVDLAEIARHDVVFVCEAGETVRRIPGAAGPSTVVIDLIDCLPPSGSSSPTVPQSTAPGAPRGGCYSVPHPLALLLAELLRPLEEELGLGEVTGVVVRPAADFGEAGLEELRDQTVRLLRFADVPMEVFGRQLAFNVIPQAELSRLEPGLETRIARELSGLLGWPATRATVRLMTAALFHGHALQLRVRPVGTPTLDEVWEVLRRGGLYDPHAKVRPATPLEVTGEPGARVADVSQDGLGGFWIGAVAGETGGKAADHAVRLAARLGVL
jgi:aspartate-semialdehyde dehydrogenase